MRRMRRWASRVICAVICLAITLAVLHNIRWSYNTTTSPSASATRVRFAKGYARDLPEGDIDIKAFFNYHGHEDKLQQQLYAKAFGSSTHGTRMLPYYFGKEMQFAEDRLTLTTWLTADRLQRLGKIADTYRGPISAVFHLSPDNALATEELHQLHSLWQTHPTLHLNTDLHLVTSRFTVQHNAWRNVARFFATTDWVFMIDADFDICGDLEGAFEGFRRDARGEWRERLEKGEVGLVVPAFEWVVEARKGCPADKSELISLYKDVQIDIFELETPSLHFATDYSRFIQANEPYPVEQFDWMYEPYLIFRRDVPVWCDERFVGFGYDRAACVGEMYLRAMDFHVLVEAYIVHEEHYKEDITGPMRRQNRMRWYTFRKELCVRLAQDLEKQHTLHLFAGDRIREHCQLDREDDLDRYMAAMMKESKGEMQG